MITKARKKKGKEGRREAGEGRGYLGTTELKVSLLADLGGQSCNQTHCWSSCVTPSALWLSLVCAVTGPVLPFPKQTANLLEFYVVISGQHPFQQVTQVDQEVPGSSLPVPGQESPHEK